MNLPAGSAGILLKSVYACHNRVTHRNVRDVAVWIPVAESHRRLLWVAVATRQRERFQRHRPAARFLERGDVNRTVCSAKNEV